jgi:phosphoribosylformylglycinamidine cyclo-ligase
LGLDLDAAALVLPPVFDWLQREGQVAREEMWRTFNCGVGFTVIVPRDGVEAVSALLGGHGLASSVIGRVVTATGAERVRIG